MVSANISEHSANYFYANLGNWQQSLQSANNLTQAVLRKTAEDPLGAKKVSLALKLNVETIRIRFRKPHLWNLSELRKVARLYRLPTAVIDAAEESLTNFSSWLMLLPPGNRNTILRQCQMDTTSLRIRMRKGWGITDVLRLLTWLQNRRDLPDAISRQSQAI